MPDIHMPVFSVLVRHTSKRNSDFCKGNRHFVHWGRATSLRKARESRAAIGQVATLIPASSCRTPSAACFTN